MFDWEVGGGGGKLSVLTFAQRYRESVCVCRLPGDRTPMVIEEATGKKKKE